MKNITHYDHAVQRMKCYSYDEFTGLSTATNEEQVEPNSPPSPVFAAKFCNLPGFQHFVALADEDGRVALQDTRPDVGFATKTKVMGSQAHLNAIFDLAWMDGEMKLVTVSGDHRAILWDLAEGLLPLTMFLGHTRSVKTVAFRPDDKAVFATGGRDGNINVWDVRSREGVSCEKPDNFIPNCHQPSTTPGSGSKSRRDKGTLSNTSRANSITGLVYQDPFTLLSCSASGGLIKVWDLRKNYSVYKRAPVPLHVLPHPGGSSRNSFTSLVLDPGRVRLYASCIDDVIYCYNVATYEKTPVCLILTVVLVLCGTVATYTGHLNSTFYVKSGVSPDGRYLLSGSSDGKPRVWNTSQPGGPLVHLVGHEEEVTAVTWSADCDMKIVTCSDEPTHRIWRVGLEDESENDYQLLGWAETFVGENKFCSSETLRPTKRYICSEPITPESTIRSDTFSSSEDLAMTTDSIVSKRKRSPGSVCGHTTNENRCKKQKLQIRGSIQLCTPPKSVPAAPADGLKDFSSYLYPRGEEVLSPTSNLPNFVRDKSSSLHTCSRALLQKENVDWLTKLRKTKAEKPLPNVSENGETPKQRTSSRSVLECRGKVKRAQVTLLKFFKVSGKSTSEQSCASHTLPLHASSDAVDYC
uniref:(California timema) hypothetical protein n=1 Tax=Timema californicum TaxID=61474 RepID=A0A7R9P915_TIMCA|nr:unnamed protein product [Timema californicum]